MKAFAVVLFLGMMTLASPVFAQKVAVQYGHQVDFSKYTTYRWGKNKGQLANASDDEHIKRKLDRTLQAKGLRRVDSGPADLVVAYQTTEQKEQEVDNYGEDDQMGLGMGWGYGMGWGMGWGDMGSMGNFSSQGVISTIHKGDLLVDMADPKTKKMVFRAYSAGAFHSNPIKEDKLMSKAINKMFKKFPPKEK